MLELLLGGFNAWQLFVVVQAVPVHKQLLDIVKKPDKFFRLHKRTPAAEAEPMPPLFEHYAERLEQPVVGF